MFRRIDPHCLTILLIIIPLGAQICPGTVRQTGYWKPGLGLMAELPQEISHQPGGRESFAGIAVFFSHVLHDIRKYMYVRPRCLAASSRLP